MSRGKIPPAGGLSQIYPGYDRRNHDPRRRLFGRLFSRILPRHLLEPLRFELRAAWIRLGARRAVRRFRGASDVLVNVGSGSIGRPGWINLDLFPGNGVDCVYDCRKSLPFPEGSVRGIFCEHFLEHVDYTEELPYFLSECFRVLRPGGVLRVIVPDAELYARAYCAQGWDEIARLRSLEDGRRDPHVGGSYRTKMELVNVVFRQGFQHKFAYDFETLAEVLRAAGFADVERSAFDASRKTDLRLDRESRRSESLYVEASKPPAG